MTHTTPNPHDAEEQLRPYLGQVHDAEEATEELGTVSVGDLMVLAMLQATAREIAALNAALSKALDLLGVQR